MSHTLEGKTALVTGAGVRLGRAIALGLARSGCDLILHYHRSKREAQEVAAQVQELGRRTQLIRADLREGPAATRLARQAERVFGQVDILVNSAAIFWPTPLEKLSEREFDVFMSVNLKAPYLLSAELGRRMKKRLWGSIVNIADIAAARPWKTHVPYSLTKSGIVSLTISMAKLLAPEVRVNGVAPGSILPPPGTSAAYARKLARAVPLKRLGDPADIAAAVVYLCQAEYVTGQILNVDGGRSIV